MNQAGQGKTRTDVGNDAPIVGRDPSRRQVALALMQWLDREFSSYAILGAWDDFPDSIPSDIDVAIPECEVDRSVAGLDRFCHENGLSLVQIIRHVNGLYCVLAWFTLEGRPTYIALDFNPGYWLRGRLLAERVEQYGMPGQEVSLRPR